MLLDLFRSNKCNGASENDTHQKRGSVAEDKSKFDREEFLSYSHQSGLHSPADWPSDSPLMILGSQRAKEIMYDVGETNYNSCVSPIPMNGRPIPFNGPNFEGKLVSRMQDVPSSHNGGHLMSNCDYFRNRSRQYQWCVQGRFKHRVRFDKIVTGQEFGRPFRNAPSRRMLKKGLDLLKHKLPESFECELLADEPRFEHPLLAGCQSFRVDRPEEIERLPESAIHGIGEDGNVIENTLLLEDEDIPRDGVARRKYFSKNCNLERHYFEPEFVYTFDFFANFFSPARHRLELTPFFSIDLIPYFNGYPLFMSMAKDKSTGEYLWATEMWHQRLLNYDESPGRIARLFSSSESRAECDDEDFKDTVCETES